MEMSNIIKKEFNSFDKEQGDDNQIEFNIKMIKDAKKEIKKQGVEIY